MSQKIEDLVIVGDGPAGLSAGIYAFQAGFKPLLIASHKDSLIATTDLVNNYLGFSNAKGKGLHTSFKNHYIDVAGEDTILKTHVTGLSRNDDGHFIVHTAEGDIEARALIWATGANPKKLGVSGEDTEAVSYCATCDGSFYEGDPNVVVIGGGDAAVEEALYLAEIVDSVTMLVRSDLRAKQELQDRLEANEKITVLKGVSVSEFETIPDEMDIRLHLEWLEDNDSNAETLTTSGAFVAIGQIPNSDELFADHFKIDVTRDEAGFVTSNGEHNLFIAGDVSNPAYRQAIIAAGDGAKAGIDASNYLRENK